MHLCTSTRSVHNACEGSCPLLRQIKGRLLESGTRFDKVGPCMAVQIQITPMEDLLNTHPQSRLASSSA